MSSFKKIGTIIILSTFIFNVLNADSIRTKASTKAKSISVVPENKVIGNSKILYVNGPSNIKSTRLKTKVMPSKASQKVRYLSSNQKVAIVNTKGKVVAKKAGKATITVISKENSTVKKRIKFQIKKYVYPTSMKVAVSADKIKNGKTCKLSTVFAPASTSVKLVTYHSSDKTLATVSRDGVVTANNNGKTGTVQITVSAVSKTKVQETLSQTVNIKIGEEYTKTVYLNGTDTVTKAVITLEEASIDSSDVIAYASSDTDVATIDSTGTLTAKRLGKTIVTVTTKSGEIVQYTVYVKCSDIAIHDPSVYKDPISGNYYTFGSHLAAATSTDLIGWSWTANSDKGYSSENQLFTKEYKEEFAEPYAFTMPDGANENAWAPDIIYNTSMKKYCMYISIVNGSKKCCIAMATSDQPDGPYSYQGMIVCSGITEDDIDKTNVASALGITNEEAKESKYATMDYYSPDCIDATVFYDHSGNLWMVYGSFTTLGGIRLLKLDPDTGLRGTNYEDSKDETKSTRLSTQDPYYGLKIANNNGEGAYIQEVKCNQSSTGYYYYLWFSTGELQSYGGYNMRMLRSERVEGPYLDTEGNEAVPTRVKKKLGLRVMDNYKFSFMDTAFTSCGGNSATTDENGKTFLHFHQKFANGTEEFRIRTHQTFLNEDGWLVTAPFEYNGETIADSYAKEDVAGDYEFIYHRITFMTTNHSSYDYVSSEKLTLNRDGTVTGAYTGTWKLDGHYISIEINDQTYKGVVLEQYEQTDDRDKVMVFTAVGNDNRSIWGSKMH